MTLPTGWKNTWSGIQCNECVDIDTVEVENRDKLEL
jgi:hypothetical protein